MNLKKYSKNIKTIFYSFSLTEKVILAIFFSLFLISIFSILIQTNNRFLVDIPNRGGTFHEGVVGTPRFINPLLAVSDADKDLTSLIFSGLTRKNVEGEIVPDLAEQFEVSEDRLEYHFYLRNNLEFHDGTRLTTDDVIFTILKAQEPSTESPKRANWEGVSIERVSETEIIFKLKQPYSDFLENTTLGILPRHLWEDIVSGGFSLSKYNVEPIGSGPYAVKRIKRDSTNIPKSYTLESFKNYALGRANVNTIVFHFARNDEELVEMFNGKTIDSMGGIDPESVSKIKRNGYSLVSSSLPRIFGIFLNQNENPILAEGSVREALNVATPKESIVNDILYGFAKVVNEPTLVTIEKEISAVDKDTADGSKAEAAKIILEKAGWQKNENGIYTADRSGEPLLLSLTVSTSNIPELVLIAEKIVDNWEAIGAEVNLKIFDISDLNQSVIRPRNFEALLFGMVVDKETDLYAFWHSSQRADPGLNITGYANITADSLLEELRNNIEKQKDTLVQFNNVIKSDRPAIFLYAPEFIYIVPEKIKGVEINNIIERQDRFLNIADWYIETEKVWKIFN